jgi:hypothetical protein
MRAAPTNTSQTAMAARIESPRMAFFTTMLFEMNFDTGDRDTTRIRDETHLTTDPFALRQKCPQLQPRNGRATPFDNQRVHLHFQDPGFRSYSLLALAAEYCCPTDGKAGQQYSAVVLHKTTGLTGREAVTQPC